MDIILKIENPDTGKVYIPLVEDGIKWTTSREGTPGSLEFTVVKDNIINFQEGNRVELTVDNTPVFCGFVFKKSRTKESTISVKAYDQLRYFKNKDTMIYEDKTATQVLQMIANDYSLFTGDLADTKYVMSAVEDNSTLFDIMKNILDATLINTKEMYVLYDDFGKLTIKNVGDMKVNLKIDDSMAEDFDYETSIDGETYNKVKLLYEDSDSGKMEVFTAKSDYTIKKWGVLQYFDKIDNTENALMTAQQILSIYNNKSRSLSINGIFGDLRVRAGSQVPVFLNLGDIVANTYFIVEKCTHTFKQNQHTMDIELMGGEYIV
jgi:hypothetical protein